MVLDNFNCNHLMPLRLKGLTCETVSRSAVHRDDGGD